MFALRHAGWALLPAILLVSACRSEGSATSGEVYRQAVDRTSPAVEAGFEMPALGGAPTSLAADATGSQRAAALTAEPLTGDVHASWTEDAARGFFNSALELPWAVEMGTWRDRNATAQGTLPFASLAFVDRPAEQVVRWNVTDQVRLHGADFLIRRSGGTSVRFHSREAADAVKRPRLIVSRPGGLKVYVPIADTALSPSSVLPQGELAYLNSSGPMLLKFDLGADSSITRAELEMTATTAQYGNQTLDVFRADARPKPVAAPSLVRGTATDVVLALSGSAWKAQASRFQSDRMTVNADGSLTVRIPAGSDTGSTSVFTIPVGSRRSVMFSRTVMRIHDDWTATMGGKFPGLANTGRADGRAAQCGWGGRLADGTCWSARTNRKGYAPKTPYADSHQALSPYVYRVNRTSANGEGPPSSKVVPKGRFFALDQMVKLNSIAADGTPRADGEIAYWLDGELINRMTGVVWRSHSRAESLPSEYWLDVYEGGTGYAAPHPHSVTFKEVLVSTRLLPFDAAALAALNASRN